MEDKDRYIYTQSTTLASILLCECAADIELERNEEGQVLYKIERTEQIDNAVEVYRECSNNKKDYYVVVHKYNRAFLYLKKRVREFRKNVK